MAHWEKWEGDTDEWYTPKVVFDALKVRFDLDVAAPLMKTNVPADNFITNNSLVRTWKGFVWVNPPFGGRNDIEPWLDRFFEHGNGIALTADRTSAGWFRRAWKKADLVLFTKKLRFVRPDGSTGQAPSNGTALWAVGALGCAGLRNAAKVGFGALARPEHG